MGVIAANEEREKKNLLSNNCHTFNTTFQEREMGKKKKKFVKVSKYLCQWKFSKSFRVPVCKFTTLAQIVLQLFSTINPAKNMKITCYLFFFFSLSTLPEFYDLRKLLQLDVPWNGTFSKSHIVSAFI